MIKLVKENLWLLGKLLIVLILTFVFGRELYKSLNYSLNVPSVEIKNTCQKNDTGFSCARNFDVSIYSEEIKATLGEIPKSQTFLEKLAGITPDLLKYSVGFKDESIIKIWEGQHSRSFTPTSPGLCKFPDGFEQIEGGGRYKKEFGLLEIPTKLKELATSLNDCRQFIYLHPEGSNFEREEKYNIFVKTTFRNWIILIFLSLSLTMIVLKVIKFLWKFIVKKYSE